MAVGHDERHEAAGEVAQLHVADAGNLPHPLRRGRPHAGQLALEFNRFRLQLRDDFVKTTDPPGSELTGRIESTIVVDDMI